MLSPDPVKRSINPYPYCDNDPVNYNDPTGEIANILVGAGIGGYFGGAAGFLGNAASQLMDGGKFNWRKAAGAAANGAVVGAAKGALVGSGVGVLGAFATDFAAGTVGSALEQGISRGRVDIGESLLSGAGNALSEVLYGTGELKGVKDAFLRGARTGAVMSGLENITDHVGSYGVAGEQIFGKKADRAVIPTNAGRDPKGMCGASDPFDLSGGLGNGRGYQSGRAHGGAGHSRTGENGGFNLGGFVRDVLTGAVTGGLGSAGFYGAGKAVDALRWSVAGHVDSVESTELVTYYPSNNGVVLGTERKVYLLPGDKIDRYGKLGGKYFSPVGTPLAMRALPYNADTTQYGQFEVVKPFEVEVSVIKPWFGKIGLGVQYRSAIKAEILLKRGIIKMIGEN